MAQTSKKKKSATKKPASKHSGANSTKRASAAKTSKKASGSKKKAASHTKASASSTKASASKKTKKKTKRTASAPKKKATAKKKSAATKAKSKKPAASRLDKKFLAAQKAMLLEERAKYLHSADILAAEADSLLEAREPGDVQFDEESGEGDTLAVERERDLALSAQARAAVGQIDAALGRLTDGTYGVCVVSGKPIPKERLQAIPWAAERVEFKAGGIRR